MLILFEYLIVSLDKISNKKNYFENNESFYIINIEKGHYIQLYIKYIHIYIIYSRVLTTRDKIFRFLSQLVFRDKREIKILG